jgi:hypothetical protein
MKGTDKNAVEILQCGGAVAAGDWKRGTGNYTQPRPVPQKCVKINSTEIESLEHPESRRAAFRLTVERPKVRKLIVVKDWDAVAALVAVGGA